MKRCAICGATKPVEDYMWKLKAKNKRDAYCRPCRAAYKKAHYEANKPHYLETNRVRASAERRRRVRWLLRHLEAHPCADCGETDPVVLEFDHLRDKSFGISEGFSSRRAWSLILLEIEKCEVVCANCHRRRTALRGGFARAGVAQLVELQFSKLTVCGFEPRRPLEKAGPSEEEGPAEFS